MDLFDYLKQGKVLDIFETLRDKIKRKNEEEMYCTNVLGEGSFGRVKKVNQSPNIHINNQTIPIVMKEFRTDSSDYKKNPYDSMFQVQKSILENGIEDVLIFSANELTCETILLEYLTKLYHKGECLHVPRMYGKSRCMNLTPLIYTDTIVLEQQGYPYTIEYTSQEGVHEDVRFPLHDEIQIKKERTNLIRFDEYIEFIHYSKKNEFHQLKKGTEYDQAMNMIVPILYTAEMLYRKHKIQIFDMRITNIQIHWIRDDETFQGIRLKDVDGFIYEWKTKKGKTRRLVLKNLGWYPILGDVGIHSVEWQPNVVMIGDVLLSGTQFKNNEIVLTDKDQNLLHDWRNDFVLFGFGKRLSPMITVEILNTIHDTNGYRYNKTLGEIMGKKWYQKSLLKGGKVSKSDLEKVPSPLEILEDPIFDNCKINSGKLINVSF